MPLQHFRLRQIMHSLSNFLKTLLPLSICIFYSVFPIRTCDVFFTIKKTKHWFNLHPVSIHIFWTKFLLYSVLILKLSLCNHPFFHSTFNSCLSMRNSVLRFCFNFQTFILKKMHCTNTLVLQQSITNQAFLIRINH